MNPKFSLHGLPPKFWFLFFLQWAILIAPHTKNRNLGVSPNCSFSEVDSPPCAQLYITEKGKTNLSKGYGIKWGVIGRILEEQIGNLGKIWGHAGNMMEMPELFFNPSSSLPPREKKKREASWVYVQLSHCLHAYYIHRHGWHHFLTSGNTPSTKHTIPICFIESQWHLRSSLQLFHYKIRT
jgi:hypothetical protein